MTYQLIKTMSVLYTQCNWPKWLKWQHLSQFQTLHSSLWSHNSSSSDHWTYGESQMRDWLLHQSVCWTLFRNKRLLMDPCQQHNLCSLLARKEFGQRNKICHLEKVDNDGEIDTINLRGGQMWQSLVRWGIMIVLVQGMTVGIQMAAEKQGLSSMTRVQPTGGPDVLQVLVVCPQQAWLSLFKPT